jgi:hypothetical protein
MVSMTADDLKRLDELERNTLSFRERTGQGYTDKDGKFHFKTVLLSFEQAKTIAEAIFELLTIARRQMERADSLSEARAIYLKIAEESSRKVAEQEARIKELEHNHELLLETSSHSAKEHLKMKADCGALKAALDELCDTVRQDIRATSPFKITPSRNLQQKLMRGLTALGEIRK